MAHKPAQKSQNFADRFGDVFEVDDTRFNALFDTKQQITTAEELLEEYEDYDEEDMLKLLEDIEIDVKKEALLTEDRAEALKKTQVGMVQAQASSGQALLHHCIDEVKSGRERISAQDRQRGADEEKIRQLEAEVAMLKRSQETVADSSSADRMSTLERENAMLKARNLELSGQLLSIEEGLRARFSACQSGENRPLVGTKFGVFPGMADSFEYRSAWYLSRFGVLLQCFIKADTRIARLRRERDEYRNEYHAISKRIIGLNDKEAKAFNPVLER